jgi:predicted acyltransferase
MVPVNVAADFRSIPAWFKHAPGPGLTLADFVVPLFLFSLGLASSFSFKSRVRDRGYGRTCLHALLRYASLFAFGSIGILLVDHSSRWEILQMLGATGLFSFFFLLLSPWPRFAAAGLILALVEILRPLGLGSLMSAWYETGIAGPWGTFSLSFFAITASSLGELLKEASPQKRISSTLIFAGVLAAAGLFATRLSPFSKHSLSLSYILFTAGVSSALLAILLVLHEKFRLRLPVAGSLGRNALVLYMLHSVIGVGLQALLGDSAQPALAWAASFFVLGICVLAATLLDRKALYIKL